MTDKLAGLVLPDATPLERLSENEEETSQNRKLALAGIGAIITGFRMPSPGDVILAGCGISLATVCAVFPWYIFFNQEQFGVKPLTFSAPPDGRNALREEFLSDLTVERMPDMQQFDFLATGTVPETPTEALAAQPFPGDRQGFHLLHAENGRALIEDKDGFWVVQRGSLLPDGNRVVSIEERNGTWALITSEPAEITLSTK